MFSGRNWVGRIPKKKPSFGSPKRVRPVRGRAEVRTIARAESIGIQTTKELAEAAWVPADVENCRCCTAAHFRFPFSQWAQTKCLGSRRGGPTETSFGNRASYAIKQLRRAASICHEGVSSVSRFAFTDWKIYEVPSVGQVHALLYPAKLKSVKGRQAQWQNMINCLCLRLAQLD
jgi:hypothetical protein